MLIFYILKLFFFNSLDLRQKYGDVFVEDSSIIEVGFGNLWVYGSVVGQDRGIIKATMGNIIAVQVYSIR